MGVISLPSDVRQHYEGWLKSPAGQAYGAQIADANSKLGFGFTGFSHAPPADEIRKWAASQQTPQPPGGRTNRYDGSGWAGDGTRIQPGGYAQPQQSPYATSTPYGQKPQSNPYQQWNQGGTNQQQTRQPSLTDYMAPGSPMPGRTPRQPTGYQGYQPTSPSSQPRITPSISFAPGTPEEYKNQAYNNWNNNGWASQPRPADYGNDFRRPPSAPRAGDRSDPAYRDWRSKQMTTMVYRTPAQQEELEQRMYDQWSRGQGGGQAQPQQNPYAGSSPYGQGAGGMSDSEWRSAERIPAKLGQQPPAGYTAVGGSRSDPAVYFMRTEDVQRRMPALGRWPSGLQTEAPPPAAFPQQPMVPPGGVGNWGNQMQGRPDPFYMDGADPFGGWGGMDQFLGQRAAFVNNINQHRGMTAAQGLPPAPMDFNQMWNQAGQMYQQGWQNPLQGLFG